MPLSYLSWIYLPGNTALLTGINNAGFGAGAFLFTLYATQLVNPDGLQP